MQHNMARVLPRLARHQEFANRQALPLVVITRPGSHAVDVGDGFGLRLCNELPKIPEDRMFDRAVDVKPPPLAGNIGHQPEIEDWPVPGQMLSGRQTLVFGARDSSGEKAAFASPALFGTGE